MSVKEVVSSDNCESTVFDGDNLSIILLLLYKTDDKYIIKLHHV